jgi:hypothetical protein
MRGTQIPLVRHSRTKRNRTANGVTPVHRSCMYLSMNARRTEWDVVLHTAPSVVKLPRQERGGWPPRSSLASAECKRVACRVHATCFVVCRVLDVATHRCRWFCRRRRPVCRCRCRTRGTGPAARDRETRWSLTA